MALVDSTALGLEMHVLVRQDAQLGTIQGTVMREGTTEPLADVQITVVARGSLAATGFKPGAYQNAEFMQKYEARGTNVVVTAGVQSNSDVTLIRD